MRIAVAMSGGVDSSVVAHILKEEGHDVVGFFMRNGIEANTAGAKKSCCSASDARDAAVVADQLGIPFYSLNIADGFSRLLDYFADEYMAGRTPSPCVHCNGWLKFGALLESARECGADVVATGHYARVGRVAGADGAERVQLLRAVDATKDQTYFLFSLTQEQLSSVWFPLGERTKEEVRELARRADLIVQDKPESQEICFAPAGDYAAVVERVTGIEAQPGPIVDRSGRHLGTHKGTIHYTIGQRRGLGLALGDPHYVVAISPEERTIVLGTDDDLLERDVAVSDVNWIGPAPQIDTPIRASAKIRYRHPPCAATIVPLADGRATIRFDEPQRAITPGQAAVFLDGDTILGGGWIDSAAGGSQARVGATTDAVPDDATAGGSGRGSLDEPTGFPSGSFQV